MKSAPALAPAAASPVSTWQDRLNYVDGWEPLPEVRNIKSSPLHNWFDEDYVCPKIPIKDQYDAC
eukprot:7345190-Karenia_brevis.AAC.1